MTPDFVTLMAASKRTDSYARSALPDAPVIEDFIDRSNREPRISLLRKQLAELIWPGELKVFKGERSAPAASC